MKKLLIVLLILGLTASVSMAKEVVLNVKITDMVEKVDRNGNDYVRFIATMQKELQGETYEVGTPIMAFGSVVPQAKSYKVGDDLKAIAKYREFDSRESYTILKFLP